MEPKLTAADWWRVGLLAAAAAGKVALWFTPAIALLFWLG